jgi:hypothetical protein
VRYIKLKDFCLRTVCFPLLSVPLRYFIAHTVIIFGAVLIAGDSMMLNPGGFVNTLLPETYDIVGKFIKWDAHWYTYIAQQGYDNFTVVFFPMLIILIKITAPICNYDYGLAGFFVCNIFSAACFFLMYSLFQIDFTRAVSARALMAFAAMPTSFFLHSIYTEPVFLTFSLACAYYARIGKWWRAGSCAAMAALTRNIGVFLVFFLICEYWEQYQKERFLRRLPTYTLLAIALPLLALLGFIVYNYWLFGDPLAFVSAQKAWGREFSPPWVNIGNGFIQVLHGAETAILLDFLMVLLGVVALLVMTFLPGLNIPRSYLVISWLWLLVPLCSTSPWMPLYSMSRFVLVIFPLYLYIARFPTCFFRVFILISAIVMALCSILFTNWYWLS